MNTWTFGEIIGISILGLMAIYLVARLISAAVFKSKQQYEKEKRHGTQSNS